MSPRPPSRRALRRVLLAASTAVVVAIAGVLVTTTVFPATDPIGRTDLVVVLGPFYYNGQITTAERVVARNPGVPVLVSQPAAPGPPCPTSISGTTTVVCFLPAPFTTQGEARYAARYATAHHDSAITVVAPRYQVSRARTRFSRCWSGQLAVVESAGSLSAALDHGPYEAAATIKAQVFQRQC